MKTWVTPFTVLLLLIVSCKKFEMSPYQVDIPEYMRDLNNRNINRLLATEETSDDTVSILFTGDSQRFYDELEDLVSKTNTLKNIDFFVLAGDITDFGLAREFTWIYERLQNLNVPYLCAIGNHDLTARGNEIYTKMFGLKNFSFPYKGYKFLFHDTNGREYDFDQSAPDIMWLKTQINDPAASWMVGVAHIPPFNEDFDAALLDSYRETFSSSNKFILALYGHCHSTSDQFYYNNHVRFIVSDYVKKREAIVLKLYQGNITKQTIFY